MKLEGLVLESKYPELNYTIKGPRNTVWKDGYPIQEPRHIVLHFERYLCLVDDMARQQEWSDEDKEFVLHALEYSDSDPSFVDWWVHEKPKPGKPWPTYDETHHNQVASVAQSIGLVQEALIYETQGRDGGPRESVVEKLEKLLTATPELEEITV